MGRKKGGGKGAGRGRGRATKLTGVQVEGSSTVVNEGVESIDAGIPVLQPQTQTQTQSGIVKNANKGPGRASKNPTDNTANGWNLANKPDRLTREDVRCPICWCILFEPTTMPCNHSVCGICFQKHIDENTLTCPCCRTRIATWVRKADNPKKLLDEVLWARIQQEFPRLVQARKMGRDSQEVLGEEEIEMPSLRPEERNSPSLLENPSHPIGVFDGTMCYNPGEVRQDLDQIMKIHQSDLEFQRLKEERESADLIKQLEEEEKMRREAMEEERKRKEEEDRLIAEKLQQELAEEEDGPMQRETAEEERKRKEEQDHLLAQKLQQEEEELGEEEMSQSNKRKSISQIDPRAKPKINNFMDKWMTQSQCSNSPDICHPTPKSIPSSSKSQTKGRVQNQIQRSSPTNSTMSSSAKRKQRPSATATSFSSTKSLSQSQELMKKFLTSSPQNSQMMVEANEEEMNSPTSSFKSMVPSFPASSSITDPCSSRSLPTHDIRFSAFSPTKASNRFNILIPSGVIVPPVPSSSSSDATSHNQNQINSKSVLADDRLSCSKTPDSINSEVDTHFRPIKSAPKTPPRRRPDGTFLPEPKLLRMSPLKPSTFSSVPSYIVTPSKNQSVVASSSTSTSFELSKPSCATSEKRISNDSGTASDIESSRTPEADADTITISPSSISVKEEFGVAGSQGNQSERGCSSDDYRVTPDDLEKNSKKVKRLQWKDQEDSAGPSPSKRAKVKVENTGNEDETVKIEPACQSSKLKLDLECSQGLLTIDDEDENYLELEAKELERFKQLAKQEAADRAYAEKLQRELSQGKDPCTRGRGKNSENKYLLRGWLKQEPPQTRARSKRK